MFLIFDVVDLHTLVSELKLTCIFFQPEKYKWSMQCSDFVVYISMFSCMFSRLKIFRRYSKIFRDLEKSSKVKDLFEDPGKIFQKFVKIFIFFTDMNKLKTFQNLYEDL